MEDLIRQYSADTPYFPEVHFNAMTGECLIKGESYMEDMYKFYKPLLSWLNTYIKHIGQPITFSIQLTYFNTSSSRALLDILDVLKMYEENKGDVTVNWYYDINDPDMLDEIEDFIIESNIQIIKIKAKLRE
ncbi:MAG: DUF1987 domain-containing protein [Bacteroidales bacterium]|nr:DUF1987 domain-containing protein [Bacteroidales bacterium]